MEDLFGQLCAKLMVKPDREGEAHVECPGCGKEVKRGQTHFSFSARGGHCFVCGASYSLAALAQMYDVKDWRPDPSRRQARERRRPERRWDGGALMAQYTAHERRFEMWRRYRSLLSEAIIDRAGLGVGAFPQYTSKCEHDRLMVPLIVGGEVVGFRGRALDCECGKWLSPSGNRTVLYNGRRLGADIDTLADVTGNAKQVSHPIVTIVENPLDALLIEELEGGYAVATLSVSYWKDEWTRAMVDLAPKLVMVMYDNDRPGNGGGQEGQLRWLAEHPKDIVPNGVRLANDLIAAGVKAQLYDWGDAPYKMDAGDLLAHWYG